MNSGSCSKMTPSWKWPISAFFSARPLIYSGWWSSLQTYYIPLNFLAPSFRKGKTTSDLKLFTNVFFFCNKRALICDITKEEKSRASQPIKFIVAHVVRMHVTASTFKRVARILETLSFWVRLRIRDLTWSFKRITKTRYTRNLHFTLCERQTWQLFWLTIAKPICDSKNDEIMPFLQNSW